MQNSVLSRAFLLSLARRLWRGWVRPIGLMVLIVAPLRSAVVDWNWVPTGSMKPTIVEGDLVLINKLAYDLRVPFTTTRVTKWAEPQRGDITVCFSPDDGTRLVKRVIGLPGDRIELRQNILYLNGEPQSYTRIDAAPYQRDVFEDPRPVVALEHLDTVAHLVMALPSRPALRTTPVFVVPEGEFFLLGDSRDNSRDSRFFGTVPRAQIIGRAHTVLLSFDRQRWLLPRLGRIGRSLDAR